MKEIIFFKNLFWYYAAMLLLSTFFIGCTDDEGIDGEVEIQFDFYFDTKIFQGGQLSESIVSFCYPKELINCGQKLNGRYFAGEETKLINIGVDASNSIEQLILEKNAAEKLAGVTINK